MFSSGSGQSDQSSSDFLSQKFTGICYYVRNRAFTGTRGELSIRTVIREFNIAAKMYDLTAGEKKRLFINAFESSAREVLRTCQQQHVL